MSSVRSTPNDQCRCEHIVHVITGKVASRSCDRANIFDGDRVLRRPRAYPILYAGTEVVEFSST